MVGFPNVGKSTFLSRVTNAQPKIANYHFTTLNPNLGVVDLEGTDGFVIADIPGLIEGASEGIGLGHQFLKHIERTRVMIHMVARPQVIAANKIDCFYGDEEETVLTLLKEEFEPKGIKVFPISAVTGKGVKELLYYVKGMLDEIKEEKVVFEKEYMIEEPDFQNEPYNVYADEKEEGVYHIDGPRVERMLGYTNLDSEKGFEFFQKFLKNNGMLEELEALGIEDGDTVEIYGWSFEYYK